MFGFMKKKNEEILVSPIEGEALPSSAASDPTFGEEMLGKGMTIMPAVGKVFSPVDGTISMVFETKHAINMVSDGGAEILIHIGLDTIKLKGEHFTAHVQDNAKVKKGDLLLEFDIDAIKAAGFDVISPVVICNPDSYKEVKTFTGKKVNPGDEIIVLKK